MSQGIAPRSGRGRGRVPVNVRQPMSLPAAEFLLRPQTLPVAGNDMSTAASSGDSSPSSKRSTGNERVARGRISPLQSKPSRTNADTAIGKCVITSVSPGRRAIPLVSSSSMSTASTSSVLSPSAEEPPASPSAGVVSANGTPCRTNGSGSDAAFAMPTAGLSPSASATTTTPERRACTTAQSPSSADATTLSAPSDQARDGNQPAAHTPGTTSPHLSTLATSSSKETAPSLSLAAALAEAFIPRSLPKSISPETQAIAVRRRNWTEYGESNKVALKHLQEVVTLAINKPYKWEGKAKSLSSTMQSWIASEEALVVAMKFIVEEAMTHEMFAMNGARLVALLEPGVYRGIHASISSALKTCLQDMLANYGDLIADDSKRPSALLFATFLGHVCVHFKVLDCAAMVCEPVITSLGCLLASGLDDSVAAACHLLKNSGDALWLLGNSSALMQILARLSDLQQGAYCPATLGLIKGTLAIDWAERAAELRNAVAKQAGPVSPAKQAGQSPSGRPTRFYSPSNVFPNSARPGTRSGGVVPPTVRTHH